MPATDVPDWTTEAIISSGQIDVLGGAIQISAGQNSVNVSTDSPPELLGTLTVANGSNTATGTFTPHSNATGILIQTPPATIAPGNGVVLLKVVGNTTGLIYYNVDSDPVKGLVPIFGADIAREGSFTVTVTWSGNNNSTAAVTNIYELFASGVQQVVGSPDQPLPVQISEAAQSITNAQAFYSGTAATSADTLIASINISPTGIRFMRECHLRIAYLASAGTAGGSMYLKGATSGTTITLMSLITQNTQATFYDTLRNFALVPLDLIALFPTDGTVQLRVSPGAGAAFAADALVTP